MLYFGIGEKSDIVYLLEPFICVLMCLYIVFLFILIENVIHYINVKHFDFIQRPNTIQFFLVRVCVCVFLFICTLIKFDVTQKVLKQNALHKFFNVARFVVTHVTFACITFTVETYPPIDGAN